MAVDNLTEVVETLLGPIQPIGCSNADKGRYDNLKAACDLVEELVAQIEAVRPDRLRHEASLKKSGDYAHEFLNELRLQS